MSDDKLNDYDMSDISSVSESSYADARADTPTMGNEDHSDSEDTLSDLSFDAENGILSPEGWTSDNDPLKSPGGLNKMLTAEQSPSSTLPACSYIAPSTQQNYPPIPCPTPRVHKAHNPTPNTSISDNNSQSLYVSACSSIPLKKNCPQVQVRVSVTGNSDMDESSSSLHLDLPPGETYQPPTVDFVSSPNQLKITQGPSFMPKEDAGPVSEDDLSFASSCRARLELNLHNGGGVKLTKKDLGIGELPDFEINDFSEPSSLYPGSDVLEDYIEDFYLPLSHESVMSRQKSFRKKVQKQLETAVTENAMHELNKFENMLSTYAEVEDDDEHEHEIDILSSPSPESNQKNCNAANSEQSSSGIESSASTSPDLHLYEMNNKVRGTINSINSNMRLDRRNKFKVKKTTQMFDSEEEEYETEPQSILDIDDICDKVAPNLMNNLGHQEESILSVCGGEETSNYFIPKTTLDKLYSVYDSNNFNNLYTLSGELKHILSPVEIEEIVAHRDHLEKVMPNVMAALSWTLNEESLPPFDLSLMPQHYPNKSIVNGRLSQDSGLQSGSKTSSISNGFHSDAGSDLDDGTSPNTPTRSASETSFHRGSSQTASFRRRIAVEKSLENQMKNCTVSTKYINDDVPSPVPVTSTKSESNINLWNSHIDSLDLEDIAIEDDIDKASSTGSSGGGDDTIFLRRDSKRFGKIDAGLVVQGLFVESKNTSRNGTLRRIRVPLNISNSDDGDDSDLPVSPTPPPDGDGKSKVHKKKITVDEELLKTSSITNSEGNDDQSQATDIDLTLSEVFHSCLTNQYSRNSNSSSGSARKNRLVNDDDPTIKSSSGDTDEDITLDLDTPEDEMVQESILGKLNSIATSPIGTVPCSSQDQADGRSSTTSPQQWKSFSVGLTEIHIDLKAIQPYRRVLSHGGYFDAEKKVAIILFSGCYLPDRSRKEYSYLMDHLFLYVLSTLEELIVEDYMLVYLHGATPKTSQPSYGWLKRCYQLIDHKLRKNLKGLYLVHPSFWLRTIVALSKPFISTKFSRKIRFVSNLAELCLELPTEHLVIPEPVLQYDFERKVAELQKHKQML